MSSNLDRYLYVPVKYPSPNGRKSKFVFFSMADIPHARDDKRLYLRRLRLVATPWGGIYLHWIYLPDDDRDPHDHPWRFTSIVLRGAYNEIVYRQRGGYLRGDSYTSHRRARWSRHVMPLHLAHRIEWVAPKTLTLVIVGRKQKEWGFWTPTGWVPWSVYNNTKYNELED